MQGADKLPDRLVFLHGASNSETDYQEEKVDNGVLQYTIGYSSRPPCEGLPIPEPTYRFTLDVTRRGEYTRTNTAAIYFKRSGIFLEHNFC
jgi:hypothetical protein